MNPEEDQIGRHLNFSDEALDADEDNFQLREPDKSMDSGLEALQLYPSLGGYTTNVRTNQFMGERAQKLALNAMDSQKQGHINHI